MSETERKLALERYKLLEPHLQNGRELRSVSEHVNLTGDYTWHTNKKVAKGASDPSESREQVFPSLSVRKIPFLEVAPSGSRSGRGEI
jgi:hypothetical protein